MVFFLCFANFPPTTVTINILYCKNKKEASMISNEQMDALFMEAQNAARLAYAPYSKFRVGAALVCEDGGIITGVNVENRSFGLSICAEQNAITTAIAQGKRNFLALAVSTPDSITPVSPCGACRQILGEFLPSDTPIRFGGSSRDRVNTTMGELLPWDALHELKNN